MVRRRRFAAALVALALVGAACGSDSSGGPIASGGPSETVGDAPSAVEPTPMDADASETDTEVTAGTDDGASAATIRRTADGVPHIVAEDLGGLGFGYGYAFAEDQACSLIDMIVQVRSERARWHGAGPDDRYLHADLVYAALGIMDTAQTEYAALDPDLAQLVDGYAAGFDAYLDEVGPDGLNGWCAGAPWVGPITPVELVAYYKSLALRASIDPLIDYIAIATPPVTEASERGDDTATPNADSEDAWAELGAADSGLASNGWAIGPDRTADGTSMIVGNPHFPWEGALRFYEVQLTIPGRLDVYGASLLGVPVVNIGFNEHVAWSHTVSAGSRFTAYTLDLVEGDPTRYVYGDETREFEQRTASVEVLQSDDSISTVEQTLWFSHYGPVLDFPGIGWTNTTTLTLRDANADNDEIVEQWFL
ncbi:MAG: penicillin acylase family protein, partial [Acidimicrobiales bacterium]|nr:penicillin acylase family protein [Acidimicrobiales bacterium]